jgi:hypothetical protein
MTSQGRALIAADLQHPLSEPIRPALLKTDGIHACFHSVSLFRLVSIFVSEMRSYRLLLHDGFQWQFYAAL